MHVGVRQQRHQVGHEAGERLAVHVRPGHLVEEIAQERVSLGDQALRLLAGEARRQIHDAGGEQAVGQRLRQHVGEFARLLRLIQVGDQGLGEGFPPAAQQSGSLVSLECGRDDVADQVRQPGHAHGQKLRAGDRRGLVGQEIAQQLPDRFRATLFGGQLAACPGTGQPGGSPQLAVGIPAELQIIGQDQVRQGAAIAGQLLGALRLVQRLADVLGLDVADVDRPVRFPELISRGRRSRRAHAMRCGSLIAVTPGANASISAFSAGRCVCSVALPAARAASICLR